MTNEEISKRFTYYYPNPDMAERCERIRHKASMLAAYINEYCPESREQSLALTKLEEVTFWANASICREK